MWVIQLFGQAVNENLVFCGCTGVDGIDSEDVFNPAGSLMILLCLNQELQSSVNVHRAVLSFLSELQYMYINTQLSIYAYAIQFCM